MRVSKFIIIAILAALLPLINLSVELDELDQHSLVNKYSQIDIPASQDLLIIEIDNESLKHFKKWPWKRSVYAELLDKLGAAFPKMVLFDVDFSSISSFAEDQKLATAIEKAQFPIVLPTVIVDAQQDAEGNISYTENQPLSLFAEHAQLANANALPDENGRVFKYYPTADNGRVSIANAMAKVNVADQQAIWIDYSIDPYTIPTYSVKDIIEGNFNSAKIANKYILIGSTAIDLGDMYTLPKYGRIPGVYVHALGYETLISGKFLKKIGENYLLIMAMLLLTLMALVTQKLKLIPSILWHLFGGLAIYILNVVLHHFASFILPTSLLFIALAISLIYQVFRNLKMRTEKFLDERNRNNFNKAIMNQMIRDSSNGIIITDAIGRILVANQKAKQIFDIADNSIANRRSVFEFISGSQELIQNDRKNNSEIKFLEQILNNNQGQEYNLELMVNKAEFIQSIGTRGKTKSHQIFNFMITDVTEKMNIIAAQKRSEIALIDLKNNDPVTKLPNAHSFKNILHKTFESKMSESSCMVLLINLDSLKEINEIYGGSIANLAVSQVANNLKQVVGKKVSVARMSEQVFALLYNHINAENKAQQLELIQQVQQSFTKAMNLNGQKILMSTSIGIVMAPMHGDTPETLLNNAVQALDYAMSSATINYFIYEDGLAQKIRQKRELKTELLRAIEDEEFILYYQPQHNIATGDLIGYESLIRWQDPYKGLRFPDEFIPAAEEFGLIVEIGELVLKMGCSDAANWPDHMTVAINVSPAQFVHADMAALCVKYLEQSGLPAHRLELEVTESMMMDDIENVIDTLGEVKKLGVKVAMDDFGTGYSSLQYLTRLPFDKIKIDRSFTMNIGKSKQADALITSIISLGHSLDKIVLAEGIETADMLILLKAAGCEIGQGYHYSRPMSITDVQRQIGLNILPGKQA